MTPAKPVGGIRGESLTRYGLATICSRLYTQDQEKQKSQDRRDKANKSLPGVGGTQICGYVAENAVELVDKGLKDREPTGGNMCAIRRIGMEEDLRPPEYMLAFGRSPRTSPPWIE